MDDDYSVGYGKPPRQHQFKQGNQVARKRKGQAKAIALPDLIDRALRTKRKVKRGDTITSVPVAEILVGAAHTNDDNGLRTRARDDRTNA